MFSLYNKLEERSMFKDIIEAKQYIKKNDVRYVDLKLVDLKGTFRHITIPA